MANPLKFTPSPDSPRVVHLDANEFAAIARETGQFDKAKLWDKVAEERGEPRIHDGLTVRYISDTEKRIVRIR